MKLEQGQTICAACSVCGGDVIRHEYSDLQPNVDVMHIPIGPGSRGYYMKYVKFWCGDCGLMYKFPPKSKEKQENV